jgi:hypothetical protein
MPAQKQHSKLKSQQHSNTPRTATATAKQMQQNRCIASR